MELGADARPFAVTLIKPSGIDTPTGHHAAVHEAGEARGRAMIPPLVYAPETVARAICDSAEHVRRDVTVGFAGRAQVLVGTHFPRLIDLATPLMRRLLFDRDRSQPDEDSMFAPRAAGEERSGDNQPRETSAYTAALRHPRSSRAPRHCSSPAQSPPSRRVVARPASPGTGSSGHPAGMRPPCRDSDSSSRAIGGHLPRHRG